MDLASRIRTSSASRISDIEKVQFLFIICITHACTACFVLFTAVVMHLLDEAVQTLCTSTKYKLVQTSTNSLIANLKIQQLNPAVVLWSIPCVQRSGDSVPISVHRVRGKQQRGDCWCSKAEESQDQVSAQFHGQKLGTWPLWVWVPGCENLIKIHAVSRKFSVLPLF